MITIIVYNDIESQLQFLLVEGDYSRFNGVMVNCGNGTGYENEFCDWMFDKEGNRKHVWTEDKSLLENKNWDKVAICTWIP